MLQAVGSEEAVSEMIVGQTRLAADTGEFENCERGTMEVDPCGPH